MTSVGEGEMVSPLREYQSWPPSFVEKYRDLGFWQNSSLLDDLVRSSEAFPQKTAIVEGDRSITYGNLLLRVQQLASGFQEMGLKAGDKAVVQLPNCIEFFEVFFALVSLKVIPVMALPAHRRKEITHFIDIAQASLYITIDQYDRFDFRPLATALLNDTCVSHTVIVGQSDRHKTLSQVYREPIALNPGVGLDMGLMQLSGGTTNLPKLIPRTHDDYVYSVRGSIEACEWTEDTCYLAALPVSHNFTLSSPGCLGVLFCGGKLVLTQTAAPDVAFELIQKHKVNWTALVPPLLSTWLNAMPSKLHLLESLQVVQVGGARLSDSVARKFVEISGCQLQQVFGMAEGLVNYTRLSDPLEKILQTQGRPICRHDELKIVDDDDQPVRLGQVGHLLVRGPYTIRGYFRAPEHNTKAFTSEGFYRTGDLVSMDDKGYITVEGREKDQINRGGEKISVPEIESYLLEMDAILDAALVAVPDEYLGERSCAVIKKADGVKSVSIADVRRYLRHLGVADYKMPDLVKVIDEFPKTAFGKVSKKQLRTVLKVEDLCSQ